MKTVFPFLCGMIIGGFSMVATQQYEAKTCDDRLKRALGKTLAQVEAKHMECQKTPVKCDLKIVKYFKSRPLR